MGNTAGPPLIPIETKADQVSRVHADGVVKLAVIVQVPHGLDILARSARIGDHRH